jgi:hypothetical protein
MPLLPIQIIGTHIVNTNHIKDIVLIMLHYSIILYSLKCVRIHKYNLGKEL